MFVILPPAFIRTATSGMHDREGARVSDYASEEEARNGSFFGIGIILLTLLSTKSNMFGHTLPSDSIDV